MIFIFLQHVESLFKYLMTSGKYTYRLLVTLRNFAFFYHTVYLDIFCTILAVNTDCFPKYRYSVLMKADVLSVRYELTFCMQFRWLTVCGWSKVLSSGAAHCFQSPLRHFGFQFCSVCVCVRACACVCTYVINSVCTVVNNKKCDYCLLCKGFRMQRS